ncbi:MutS-related protein [Clostridium oceanicum]|uniref:MutS-related protein n=1 Tax=Clostridium oceanicum TaxID=1543 RepID=UPI0031DD8800
MFKRTKPLDYIRNIWPNGERKKRSIILSKKYNDIIRKDKENLIDDQSWSDLDMDSVFPFLDKTLTTPGEQILYNILRNPLYSESKLKERDRVISLFQENSPIREKFQLKLFKIGKQKIGNILSLLWEDLKENKLMRFLCIFFGTLPTLIIVIELIFHIDLLVIFLSIVPFLFINMVIHYRTSADRISQINSISYFSKLMNVCKEICNLKIDELSEYKFKINSIFKNINIHSVTSSTYKINRIEGFSPILDYFSILFLWEERTYYKLIKHINLHQNDLRKLYELVGEIDAFISIAAYRESLPYYTKPQFTEKEKYLKIKDSVHPLIEKPVPNSIILDKKGVILTGTNMAGKSTFLRTIGLNALMAQTIYTCTAKEYIGNFFNIVSSMAPKDNVLKGKSYYLGEAEAILRIVKKVNEKYPVLSVIDEIFRGTNPIERVATSTQILKYVIARNCIPIVATHDHELTKLLKDNYKCYYFSEDVDETSGLKFDYKIKKGISPTTNAIKLLNYLGYPKEITKTSYDMVKENQKIAK